jgi:hypothetical protein
MKIKETVTLTYICDFCNEEYFYESDMLEHEKECKQNPDFKIDEATKIWKDILKYDFRQAVERENLKAIKINSI